MKETITITASDRKSYFIFTSHIAYIDQNNKGGSTIHLSVGVQHVEIVTDFTLQELIAQIRVS